MNKGLRLWKKALDVIPGGNGLLSKRPNRYAPDIWPTYFSKAKGIHVWDLDGKKYVDMAQMGIGTAILGYNDNDVNTAVKKAIDSGINATLNAPEEVYLAEKLLELNPFAGMVKFARSGGEAMAMAVRIARAYSGRDKVAFSGYHGWCDWYLAANLKSDNELGEHLLPGLPPRGVPRGLKDTAFPFPYNDLDALKDIVGRHDIGVIVIEGARYDFPEKDFLSGIASIARKKNIVIVVDEITSGWRMTDGGVYKLFGFRPDIAVYGKAMGNGFAISAVAGKKDVMASAEETFISSTFWTERVGFTAALSTIRKLCDNRVWEHLSGVGTSIGEGWARLAEKRGIDLKVTDFKPLITFKLDHGKENPALYTLFTQEMLRRGYLASNSVYVSFAHKERDVKHYMENVDEVFGIMGRAICSGTVNKELRTGPRYEGFKRLT